MPAAIFSGSFVKTLKDALAIGKDSDAPRILNSTDDPTSVATDAPRGSVLLERDAGNAYIKQDAGSSTNWNQLAVSGTSLSESYMLENVGLSASVAASALTLNLKQADGSTDPAAGSGNQVRISFRDATEANGNYDILSVTSALSIVIPSGATLGHTSAGSDEGEIIYIYAIDNAGTVELAVSSVNTWMEDRVHSTTALSAAADSRDVLYSTTARSNVPVRLIGKAYAQQTTAGTWAAVPTRLTPTNGFLSEPYGYWEYSTDAGQSITHNVLVRVDYEDKVYASHDNSVTTGASWIFEPPVDGLYRISAKNRFNSVTATLNDPIRMYYTKNGGVPSFTELNASSISPTVLNEYTDYLTTTDDVYIQIEQRTGSAKNLASSGIHNQIIIELIEVR